MKKYYPYVCDMLAQRMKLLNEVFLHVLVWSETPFQKNLCKCKYEFRGQCHK